MYQVLTNGGSLTTTTSYVTVPNLSLPVAAGVTYHFSAYLTYQASATTSIFQPTMGGTCTASVVTYQVRIQTNVNGASNSQVQAALGLPATPAGSAPNAATTTYGAVIDGVIDVSAAGTLDVQVKHATSASTVQAGGIYLLEQVA